MNTVNTGAVFPTSTIQQLMKQPLNPLCCGKPACFRQLSEPALRLSADTLHEIIKDFHNTPARYRQLTEAKVKDAAGRLFRHPA